MLLPSVSGAAIPIRPTTALLAVLAASGAAAAQDTQPTTRRAATLPSEIAIPVDVEGHLPYPLTLDDALRLGRNHNAALKALELLPFQAAEDVRAARAVFEPELYADSGYRKVRTPTRNVFQPSLTREIVDARIGLRQQVVTGGFFDLSYSAVKSHTDTTTPGFPRQQYNNPLSLSYTQPLLRGAWSDYALSTTRIAQASLAGSERVYRREVQDTMLAIVRAYWELVFRRENYRVVAASLALAREQLRITLERIRVRDLAERDRVADEADVAVRQEELITAENLIRNGEDALRRLLFADADGMLWRRNLLPSSPIESSQVEIPGDWREPARVALRVRPDLAALRANVTVAELQLEAAERDVLPRLDLVGGYVSEGVDPEYDRAFTDALQQEFPDASVRLQFSVPIGNHAARAQRDRARLELERRRRELYSAEIDVAAEVRQAVRDLGSLAQSIRASRESVRLAETNLDTETFKQRVGTSTAFEVQRRNQELQEARSRLLRNQLDYRIAEAALMHAQGLLEAPQERRVELPK
jgi:outer membrane protein TolC